MCFERRFKRCTVEFRPKSGNNLVGMLYRIRIIESLYNSVIRIQNDIVDESMVMHNFNKDE